MTHHTGQPFYLFVSFTAVHAPMDISSGDSRYTSLQNEFGLTASDYSGSPITFGTSQSTVDQNRYELAAMTLAMDENIGKVVDKLTAEGLSENTIVVYMTDNGGAGWKPVWGGNYSYNLPLNGYKGNSSLEGSIHVPATLTWPGVVAGKKVVTDPVSSLDFMATFVNAAGSPPLARNGLDGLDLKPLLTGAGDLPPSG